MRNVLLIFLLSLFISCNGQQAVPQKQEQTFTRARDTAMESYQKQEHRFEFKEYKMYYNGQLVKADSLKNIYAIFGKPKYYDDVYDNKPLSISIIGMSVEKDKEGNSLIEYKEKKYPMNTSENRKLLQNGGIISYIRDKDGTSTGVVTGFRIQLSRYEKTLTYGPPDELDKKLMSIPPLKGYVLINGVLVGKNIKLQELRNRLGKIKNGSVFMMANSPVVIYEPETGHSFTEYDTKIDPTDDYIKLSFGYKRGKDIEDFTQLYYIDYYYSIKQ